MSIIDGQKINNTFFISINNPKSKNSMVLGFHPQLQSKIDEAENSKDINSIIIFGEGGFFCAGGDLNSLKTRRDMTIPERLETLEQLNGTIKKIKECSKPTIAAVEGGAAGAGVSLAMACDFLIMSDKSFLSLAYVKIGLTPDGGVTKLLAEVLPKQILSEMALIGDRIFAKKLFDLGFLNLISDAGEVKTDALKFSEKFKNLPRNAMFRIKTLIHHSYDNNFDEQMKLEANLMADSQGDKESMEGIDAFLEKRDPNFSKFRS